MKRVLECKPGDIGIPSIVVAEMHYGVRKSQHIERNHASLSEFLLPFEILDFGVKAAIEYGKLRTALERKGTVIGALDMLIAAGALAENLTLVTNNTKEFKRIPHLKVEDWSR